MKKRILIHSEEDQFLNALLTSFRKLNNEFDFTHIMCETEDTSYLKNKFPESEIISRFNTARGIIPKKNKQVLDKDNLEKYIKIEQMFNRFLDFKDPEMNFYGHERRSIYYDLLNFMIWILEEAKPDIVFFTNIPHQLHDSILAMICEIEKIPFLIMRETNLPGIFYFDDTFLLPTTILEKYKTEETTQIKNMEDILKNYIEICTQKNKKNLLKIYSKWRDHSITLGTISNLKSTMLSKVLFFSFQTIIFIKNVLKIFLKKVYLTCKHKKIKILLNNLYIEDFFKKKNKPYQESKTTEYDFELFFFRNILKKINLYRDYKKREQKIKENYKYIYFPLHYQPEATTYPYGDVFIDQILAIKLLSSILPNDIKILVKEHPDTFNLSKTAYIKGAFNRATNYYRLISEIDNVQVIPMKSDTFKLIDSSIAVATLTGGSGIEAILRGKPSLIFGNAWYRDCHGAFVCTTKKECKETIEKILNNFVLDIVLVNQFFSKIKKIIFPSSRTGAEPHTKFSTSINHLTKHRYQNKQNEFDVIANHLLGSFKKYLNKDSKN